MAFVMALLNIIIMWISHSVIAVQNILLLYYIGTPRERRGVWSDGSNSSLGLSLPSKKG